MFRAGFRAYRNFAQRVKVHWDHRKLVRPSSGCSGPRKSHPPLKVPGRFWAIQKLCIHVAGSQRHPEAGQTPHQMFWTVEMFRLPEVSGRFQGFQKLHTFCAIYLNPLEAGQILLRQFRGPEVLGYPEVLRYPETSTTTDLEALSWLFLNMAWAHIFGLCVVDFHNIFKAHPILIVWLPYGLKYKE